MIQTPPKRQRPTPTPAAPASPTPTAPAAQTPAPTAAPVTEPTAADIVAQYKLPTIFTDCCGGAGKFDFRRPFAQGENVYASDGRICVRMKKPIAMPETPGGIVPPAGKLGWPPGLPFAAIDLPAVEYAAVTCDHCKGSRFIIDTNMKPPRRVKCGRCNGDGKRDHLTGVAVGEGGIASLHIWILQEHGIKRVSPIRVHDQTFAGGLLFYFVGDRFDGLVISREVGK